MTREEKLQKAAKEYTTQYIDTNETDFYGNYDKKLDFVISMAFEHGVEWADRNRWISIKDDLPCNHKELIGTIGTITGVPVLIATQNRVTLGIRIKSKDDKWYWCDNSTTLSPTIEEVMFWMPIPELPKE